MERYSRRVGKLRKFALFVCVGILATVTSGVASAGPAGAAPNGYVPWKNASDVVRGLTAHGFTCKKNGEAPDSHPGTNVDGKPSRAITLVDCDGFSVVLVKDPARAHANEKAECTSSTAEDWARMARSKGLTGKNFYIVTSADSLTFPAGHKPSDFQKAFGGIVETDAQYLARMYHCYPPAR